jgi:hypothetical protein
MGLQLRHVRFSLMFHDVYYVKLKTDRSQQLYEPGSALALTLSANANGAPRH